MPRSAWKMVLLVAKAAQPSSRKQRPIRSLPATISSASGVVALGVSRRRTMPRWPRRLAAT